MPVISIHVAVISQDIPWEFSCVFFFLEDEKIIPTCMNIYMAQYVYVLNIKYCEYDEMTYFIYVHCTYTRVYVSYAVVVYVRMHNLSTEIRKGLVYSYL